MSFFNHLKTVLKHKHLVFTHCRKCGIFWQGVFHDMSKFSITEFWVSARLYQGTRSPCEKEREIYGYSAAWLHHKGRNKHHWEYWNDYNPIAQKVLPVEMPKKFVIEMFCDRVAASKTYLGDKYKDSDPWVYYASHSEHYEMHENTAKQLEVYLKMLRDEGEEKTFQYIRGKS